MFISNNTRFLLQRWNKDVSFVIFSDHMLVIRAWSSDGTIGDARAVEDAHRYIDYCIRVEVIKEPQKAA